MPYNPIYDSDDMFGGKRKARATKSASKKPAIENSSRGGGLAGRTPAMSPKKKSAAGSMKPTPKPARRRINNEGRYRADSRMEQELIKKRTRKRLPRSL